MDRKRIIEMAVTFVGEILPKSDNPVLTRQWLESLSDKEFDDLMRQFARGENYLQMIAPVADEKSSLDMDTLHDVANKYGIEFYHRIWMYGEDGSRELSNKKSIVLYLPVRIQQQMISKKISVPKDHSHIDVSTGQATGPESKGARISYPEVNNLAALGMTKMAEEFLHFRGGSEKGVTLLEQSIIRSGTASADALKPYTGKVGANVMLHSYLTAMMLKSNLLERVKPNAVQSVY